MLINRTCKITFYVLAFLYIGLLLKLPVSIYTSANYDDAMFWNNASSILHGAWLGSYDAITLLKGVGFPLFLVFNYLTGLSVTLSLSLFYLFSTVIFIKVLEDEFKINRIVILLIFVVILFHPNLMPIRIIRDNIYPALTLLFLAGIMKLYAFNTTNKSAFQYIPFGLVGGWFFLTREEGLWIVPGFALLIIIRLWRIRKNKSDLKEYFKHFLVFMLLIYLPIALVSTVNFIKYGKYITTESFIASGPYTDVLKILNSIDVGLDVEHVPVSHLKRLEAYKVSPSFQKLRGSLEDEGNFFITPGCDVYPETCGDYAGGWFMFALRNSVASIGYYHSPKEADDFYRSIYKEIKIGCERKLITCKLNSIPYMPRITKKQLVEMPGKFTSLLKMALVQEEVPDNGGPSWEPYDSLLKVKYFLGNPLTVRAESEKIFRASGWFYSNAGDWVNLICTNTGGEPDIRAITQQNSFDLMDYFKDRKAKKIRFTIKLVGDDGCGITVQNKDAQVLKLIDIKDSNSSFNIAGGQLYFNAIVNTIADDGFTKRYLIKKGIANFYKVCLPTIFVFGLASYLLITVLAIFKKIKLTPLYSIITMLYLLLVSRSLLLVMIDVSSFPAITPLYFGPGFILLCISSILSIYYSHILFNASKLIPLLTCVKAMIFKFFPCAIK